MGKLINRASLYELLYYDEEDDIPLYLDFSSKAHKILECGVGTGRVAFKLASKGKEVVGLDVSRSMIDFAEERLSHLSPAIQKRVSFVHSNLIDFAGISGVDAALVCFGTINFLLNEDALLKALRNIQASLANEGRLLIEFNTPHTYQTSDLPSDFVEWRHKRDIPEHLKLHYGNATAFSVDVRAKFDVTNRVLSQTRRFNLFDNEGQVVESIELEWKNWIMSVEDITKALSSVGFRDIEIFGSYDLNKTFENTDKVGIITCSI